MIEMTNESSCFAIKNWAVVTVDPQKDFCPGGKLAVPEGNQILEPVNQVMEKAHQDGKIRVITKDWHPEKTKHFIEFGGPWPEHCVQDTEGAKFIEGLDTEGAILVAKGMSREDDEKSLTGFGGVTESGQTLDDLLKEAGKPTIVLNGLALDYCVRATGLDARKLGYDVVLLTDATKAVNINPDDGEKALEDLVKAGARAMTTKEFLASLDV